MLDIDPKNAEAYLGKLMAELQVTNRKKLADCAEPFDDRDNFSKVIRFGDEALEKEMRGYITHIKERNENDRIADTYEKAQTMMRNAKTEEHFLNAAVKFDSISGYKDSKNIAQKCREMAEIAHKNEVYDSAVVSMKEETISSLKKAIEKFASVSEWKDSKSQIEKCIKKLDELKEIEKKERKKEDLNNKLFEAIRKSDVAAVKSALAVGADPNAERVVNSERYSALRDSVEEWPNDQIAKILIKSGADKQKLIELYNEKIANEKIAKEKETKDKVGALIVFSIFFVINVVIFCIAITSSKENTDLLKFMGIFVGGGMMLFSGIRGIKEIIAIVKICKTRNKYKKLIKKAYKM